MPQELQVPSNVMSDANAHELVRAWVSSGGLVCSLNPGTWPQGQAAIAWGIVLSDIARHVADAMRQMHGLEPPETLSEMRKVFNAELDRPSAETKGHFV
jgi:hypothetical protein